jgi:hypothetical protein
MNFSIKRVHMMASLGEISECVLQKIVYIQSRTEINYYIYSKYGCLKSSCIT